MEIVTCIQNRSVMLDQIWSLFLDTKQVMKCANRRVMFYCGHKELEIYAVEDEQYSGSALHEKFTEKLEQAYTAYQKMEKRSQMMEQEMESLSKHKQELEEKDSEMSRSVLFLILFQDC